MRFIPYRWKCVLKKTWTYLEVMHIARAVVAGVENTTVEKTAWLCNGRFESKSQVIFISSQCSCHTIWHVRLFERNTFPQKWFIVPPPQCPWLATHNTPQQTSSGCTPTTALLIGHSRNPNNDLEVWLTPSMPSIQCPWLATHICHTKPLKWSPTHTTHIAPLNGLLYNPKISSSLHSKASCVQPKWRTRPRSPSASYLFVTWLIWITQVPPVFISQVLWQNEPWGGSENRTSDFTGGRVNLANSTPTSKFPSFTSTRKE